MIRRVWECRHWQAERWNVLSGRVQAACWSPSGSTVLFCTNTEPTIFGLTFFNSTSVFKSETVASPKEALPLVDLTKIDLNGAIVGGLVQNIICDPTGKLVAVLFQDTNYVAVFNVIFQPVLKLLPR